MRQSNFKHARDFQMVLDIKFYVVQSLRYIPLTSTRYCSPSKIVFCNMFLIKESVHRNWTTKHVAAIHMRVNHCTKFIRK